MGCRIFVGNEAGYPNTDRALFFCSTTMWAFGPVFECYEDAEAFQKTVAVDLRRLSETGLKAAYEEWLGATTRCDGCGQRKPKDDVTYSGRMVGTPPYQQMRDLCPDCRPDTKHDAQGPSPAHS
ncbi:MAG TPA: hypothetical protein VJP77_05745 [Planctomycetota bacterium]|nr:hypothetical protein [Planctomycetota bacterium]